jgi:chemotaxis protein CheD
MTQAVPQERVIDVGLGELHVTDDVDAVLVARGLGSCVAVCAYDPKRMVGAMAHVVLPHSGQGRRTGGSAKFADEGIPLLLQRMEQLGAARSRIILKIVGGSQVIAFPGPNSTVANIGEQNTQAARAILTSLGLRLRGDDTGGNRGRTVRLCVGSGRLVVWTIGGSSYEV